MVRGGDSSLTAVAGGPAPHQPVLLPAVMAALNPKAGGIILDGTFGAGGYTRAILATGASAIGLDRDPSAQVFAATVAADFPQTFQFREARFGDLDQVASALGHSRLDGVVLDIGVSSMQLDQAERGFSFRNDGPLDMRMEGSGPTAADIVNTAEEFDLAAILFHLGEERDSRRIARAVVADRVKTPFTTTKQLADLVGRVVRGSPRGIHPATRTFQALRIAVNDELGQLVAGLAAAERALGPGGVLAVVTFHSLEDRIVKRFMSRAAGRQAGGSRHLPQAAATASSFTLPSGQPVGPTDAEMEANPRARSAKLRYAIRTDAPPLGLSDDLIALSAPLARRG